MIRDDLHARTLRPTLFIALLLLLLLPACGVDFGSTSTGTELFKDVRLEGELVTGAELNLTVDVTPGYSVPLRIACYYEDYDRLPADMARLAFEERATKIGEQVLEPVTDAKPGDKDLPLRDISFRFSVPESGDYFLSCLTPAAPDNGVWLLFSIDAP